MSVKLLNPNQTSDDSSLVALEEHMDGPEMGSMLTNTLGNIREIVTAMSPKLNSPTGDVVTSLVVDTLIYNSRR